MTSALDREAIADAGNPLGSTASSSSNTRPAAAAGAGPGAGDDGLPAGGAPPLARGAAVPAGRHEHHGQRARRGLARACTGETPLIAAVALRVRDAARGLPARARARRLGGADARARRWSSTSRRIHGVGASRIYFVDRYARVLDLRRRLRADPDGRSARRRRWPACTGSASCSTSAPTARDDWIEFYRELFGFERAARRAALRHPAQGHAAATARAGTFYLQLIEPEPGIVDVERDERLQRIGLGAPDVPAAVQALRARGVEFVEIDRRAHRARGALTQTLARRRDVRAGAQPATAVR